MDGPAKPLPVELNMAIEQIMPTIDPKKAHTTLCSVMHSCPIDTEYRVINPQIIPMVAPDSV